MDVILCTGDSHTWGQGAAGTEESLPSPAVAGDLRLASFCGGGYVNRLRRLVEAATGAYAYERCAPAVAVAYGLPCRDGHAVIERTPLRLILSGSLFRLQLKAQASPSAVTVTLDGQAVGTIDLCRHDPANAYRTLTLRPAAQGEAVHEVCLTAVRGSVLFYRLEGYGGPVAVVNAGIGSCPVGRYLDEYWNDYVQALQPTLTVIEPHTINDWLTGDSPAVYEDRLCTLIERLRSLGSAAVLLTVSPICGDQVRPGSTEDYDAYVEASRRAAARRAIPVADAHREMAARLVGMDAPQAFAYLYHDNWHVNDRGHALYAQTVYPYLRPYLSPYIP